MKTLILIFLIPLSIYGSCESSYYLNDQAALDSFIKDFGPCTSIDSLIIKLTCESDRITNFDSLINVQEVNYFEITLGCSNVSITGLSNLRKVSHLYTYSLDSLISSYNFDNLDTILHLEVTSSSMTSDLSNFKNTRYIEKLTLRGLGLCSGLNPLTKETIEQISLAYCSRSGQLSELTSKRHLDRLAIVNFSLGDVNKFKVNPPDELESIGIFSCFNYPEINLLPLIDIEFQVMYIDQVSGPFPSFTNIDTIDIIRLHKIDSLKNIRTSFPKLTKINQAISIAENQNLEHLGLDETEIPKDLISSRYFFLTRVNIVDNPKLDNCKEIFLCNAIQAYPDSVNLTDNGEFCNVEAIEAYCKTVNTIDLDNTEYSIYPNPATNVLRINPFANHLESYAIFNTQGQKIISSNLFNNEIDISTLNNGLYVLVITSVKNSASFRFTKQEY